MELRNENMPVQKGLSMFWIAHEAWRVIRPSLSHPMAPAREPSPTKDCQLFGKPSIPYTAARVEKHVRHLKSAYSILFRRPWVRTFSNRPSWFQNFVTNFWIHVRLWQHADLHDIIIVANVNSSFPATICCRDGDQTWRNFIWGAFYGEQTMTMLTKHTCQQILLKHRKRHANCIFVRQIYCHLEWCHMR